LTGAPAFRHAALLAREECFEKPLPRLQCIKFAGRMAGLLLRL
jgi:hypothetical protein